MKAVVLAVTLLSLAAPGLSGASCRLHCKAAIQRCVDVGYRRPACRRQLMRACQGLGQVACDVAFVPTTSTLPPASPITTTTTLPTQCAVDCGNGLCCSLDHPLCTPTGSCCPVGYPIDCISFCCPADLPVCGIGGQCQPLNVAGSWNFFGALSVNTCPVVVPVTFALTMQVTQSGTFLSGTIGALPATGEITGPNSFSFTSAPFCFDGCCGAGQVNVNNITGVPGSFTGSGSLSNAAVCADGTTCIVTWGF
jgi:hypothetical protein